MNIKNIIHKFPMPLPCTRLAKKTYNILAITTTLVTCLSAAGTANADHQNPPWDSISSSLNYVVPTDISTFENVVWQGTQEHNLISGQTENLRATRSRETVHVYDSFYNDGLKVTLYIHTDLGEQAQATVMANQFAFILGQTSYELREGVTDFAYFHPFNTAYYGSRGQINIPANRINSRSFQEKNISELTHSSIDDNRDPREYIDARNADEAFITSRAAGDIAGHDMNHSFAAWLVLRYYHDRLTPHDVQAIETTIPSRLNFFDNQQYRMHPLDNALLEDAQFATSQVTGDFNNDGYLDLAVGSPNANIEGVNNAGKVDIFYGSSSGLSSVSNEVWHQNKSGIIGIAEPGDQFGAALAVGDFGNGRQDDLAIGVPGENDGSTSNTGAVNIIYGSSNGLVSNNNQVWTQIPESINGNAEAGDRFGAALAAGNFGNGGQDDLAIGVPGEDVGSIIGAGAVNIIYGSANGLEADNNQIWTQLTNDIIGNAETGDQFGAALAVGDFGNGRQDDLAIGVPGEDAGSIVDSGAVNVIYGSSNGLHADNNQVWTQVPDSITGNPEAGDRFGTALAAGNFGNGRQDDLAIGVPGEDAGSIVDSGAVNVIYGSANGLASDNNQVWSQIPDSINGNAEAGDRFGSALTVGNFGNGRQDDLAIGVPGEDTTSTADAGAVNIIYGGPSGLTVNRNQVWLQVPGNINGEAETNDQLGTALAAGNFDGRANDDLAIGIPLKEVGGMSNNGASTILYSSSQELSNEDNHPLFGSYTFD